MVSVDFALLPVYKPSGWTSTDVINFLKKKFRLRRVGHTGTLDPFAEGVLLILLGKATRLAEYYQRLPKSYRAVGVLGLDTDTYDKTGKVLDEKEIPAMSREDFEKIVKSFRGKYLQTPPPFSAKKVKGVRAYKLARRGEKPTLKPVEVDIYDIKLLKFQPPKFEIETTVSGGTYIRSLIRDIGLKAGTVATTDKLVRTSVGNIGLNETVNVEFLKEIDDLTEFLKPPDYGLSPYPKASLTDEEVKRFINGVKIPVNLEEGIYRIYDERGSFIAMGSITRGILKPEKVFISL